MGAPGRAKAGAKQKSLRAGPFHSFQSSVMAVTLHGGTVTVRTPFSCL